MQHIIICSEDTPFSNALAAVLTHELGVDITHVAEPKDLAALSPEMADIVISHQSLSGLWQGKHYLYPTGSPRRIQAVLADIRAALSYKPATPVALGSRIILDPASRQLQHTTTNATQELTEKEQALLLFIKEQGETSREEILAAVWGFGQDIDTHTLETHLYRLRGKWREIADFDCIAATDKGYRWYEK